MELADYEAQFFNRAQQTCAEHPDPSHDMLHVRRVVEVARNLALREGALLEVVIPAAYLHDVVYVSKGDSRRAQASRLSAVEAKRFLSEIAYPEKFLDPIAHAIEAHSFSAGHPALTLEAKIVQDADRLDALGAIGIARCFAFSGLSLRPIYEASDPFCAQRVADDSTNTLDHFFIKLLNLPAKLHTQSAREEADRRLVTMQHYLSALQLELQV